MRKFNFDEIIDRKDRKKSYNTKWQDVGENYEGYNIPEDPIGMWIADMDFLCPPEVIKAVGDRAKHGIYGYSSNEAVDKFKNAAIDWYKRRFELNVDIEETIYSAGIVSIINASILEFTKPGQGVIVQQPVYYPFTDGIIDCGRELKINNLVEEDGKYSMNFNELEKLAKDPNTKLLILCNPHNPVGKVWSKEELERVCEICYKNNVLIISDEIHADLIMKGYKFTSVGTLDEKYRNNVILALAPSKTFNIAGLGASIIIVPSDELRERLNKRIKINRLSTNLFGPIAGEAAYKHGDDYVDELMEYIEANIEYAIDYIKDKTEKIKIIKPEATYLVWFDFRETGLSNEELNRKIVEEAGILVDFGDWFGKKGECFARFNFACPRKTVEEAMMKLVKTFA